MSRTYAFINDHAASYSLIKNRLNLSSDGRKRFDRLNRHLSTFELVAPGQIPIVGSDDKFDITDSCILDEAMFMAHASTVQQALRNNPAAAVTHLLQNYDLLQSLLSYGSIGIGSSTGGWSHHLNQVKQTLERIEALYQQHQSRGASSSINDFIAQRLQLYKLLDQQLQGVARYGTGLQRTARSNARWASVPRAMKRTQRLIWIVLIFDFNKLYHDTDELDMEDIRNFPENLKRWILIPHYCNCFLCVMLVAHWIWEKWFLPQ